ncbi:MAG TPA: hypothetical protein VHQ45_12390 [Gemmatimonadaceae bacterium]|nr:hypothetical protein [Gemmatimonadaceae bacterium]
MFESSLSATPPGPPGVPSTAPDVEPPAHVFDRRGRGQLRVLWARDRARNTLRHPARMAAVGGMVFVAALITLVLVPRQSQRAGAALMPRASDWRDTVSALAALDREHRALLQARAAFDDARARATAPPPEPTMVVRTLTPEELARRDSLTLLVDELRPLLARAERAPLPASYRAVAEASSLVGNPRVQGLVDSLAAVEREREAFGALGGVDPIYVSLTTQANALGRAIVQIAQGTVASATEGIAALEPTATVVAPAAPRPTVDTLGPRQRVADAQVAERQAAQLLADARANNARMAIRAVNARRRANLAAPPLAILLAALVLGVAVGYAAVLLTELASPRVAGVAEAERVARTRVLTAVRPHPPYPEGSRRQVDLVAPRLLDPRADAYRVLHLSVATTGATLPVVTITGEEPAVVATVAANLAARAAMEARSTALVDLDRQHGLVASVLRVRGAPGVAEIGRGQASWPEATVSAIVGRDLTLDVIPAGEPVAPAGSAPASASPPHTADEMRQELARVAARYDLTVLAAPITDLARAGGTIAPAADVILCARVGVTRVRDLAAAASSLRGAGLRVHGLVLWDHDGPHLEPAVPGALASRRQAA